MGEFDEELIGQCETALEVLCGWDGRSRLSRQGKDRIRRLIREHGLRVVPICGVAAMCGVSIQTARKYVASGVFQSYYVLNQDFFKVDEVRSRLRRLRTLRAARHTVPGAGRIISQEPDGAGDE